MKTTNLVLKNYLYKTGQVEYVNYLIKNTDYLSAPASSHYHNAYDGGLVDHSVGVTNNLLMLTEKLGIKWDRPESPYIIGMFHDVCKTKFYKKSKRNRKNAEGKWEEYDYYECDDQNPLGHGEKSVIHLLCHGVKLTEQEVFCIRWHMGAFDLSSMEQLQFTGACHKYPEILYVCLADQLAGIQEDNEANNDELSLPH